MKKNFYVLLTTAIFITLILSCGAPKQVQEKANTLTAEEQQGGWQLLFDGDSLTNWIGIDSAVIPAAAWKIENGELISVTEAERIADERGDIITREQYTNFEFKLDFKILGKANSGIKYFIQPGSSIGCEYQIMDLVTAVNEANKDADLYDLIKVENKQINPDGEWNQALIVVRGNHGEHWLNGIKILEYERNSDDFKDRIALSKFKDEPNFGQFEKGHILLQDHGGGVAFRNIKIRVIE